MRLLGKQLISLFCHHCQAKSLCSSATLFCHLSIPTPFQLLTTGNHLLNTVGLEKGIWKTQQWPQDWKRSVFIPIPKKGNAKECSNYSKIAFISHTSKVMLKILQGRLQQYVNRELLDAQAGFRKGRGTRDQIANLHWIIKKQGNPRKKKSASASLTALKPLTVWITTNCGKFLKMWEYDTTFSVS